MVETVFVSFFTDNWQYPQLALRLRKQLETMGLKHDIRQMASGADWLENTRIKARYIRMMLNLYPSIVWMDADSDIHQLPCILMDYSDDLFLRPHSTVRGRAWHVSVMGWKSNDKTKALCDAWIKQADAVGGTDEAAFDVVIASFAGKVSIGRMPLEYHRLPHERHNNKVITIGISKDPDKMRIKYTEGFR
ncbi:hypothetical protein [Pluralibacter sp.]|jgi:hypothetical protein|uniref:hypothetical protein n=1 Tax=Pluralibacter sp. TaxID=1920032 RepID=UPI0025F7C9C6|nr:hypothetical protein [Pluralibacter sp.]MBV8043294.1 hypothetical protein [Pluralibacter sp.]